MKKNFLLLFISVALCVFVVGMINVSAEASGYCGENLTWTLDDSGTLTISGTGEMSNWSFNTYSPWADKVVYNAVIENGVTSIGEYAFAHCAMMKSIMIPESVTDIGKQAFYNCEKLEAVTIPKGVKSLGEKAFYSCDGLTQINWNAENMNALPQYNDAFYQAGSSAGGIDVVFGDNVKNIPDNVFSNSNYLTSITIGENVTRIGFNAFASCVRLKRINWNANNASVSMAAFCDYKHEVQNGEGITVVFGDNVEEIPDRALEDCSRLTSIQFGKNVTSIGYAAFANCTGLTNITLPETVTSIGISAFDGCTGLSGITIPDSVTTIDKSAFSRCSGAKSITIGKNATSIGVWAFYGCTSLEQINWNAKNAGDFAVGDYIFENAGQNSNGINVVFGDKVESIPNYTFSVSSTSSAIRINNLTIGNNVKTIGEFAFEKCSGMTFVTIPEGVISIKDSAFRWCNDMVSVTLPGSVTSIGTMVFGNCSGLVSIIINENNMNYCSYNGVMFNKDKTTLILFPGGNTEYMIPDGVTSIGDLSFYMCNGLTEITIPNSVKKIGSFAFNGCSCLTDVYYDGTEEEWNSILFDTYNEPLLNANIHFLNEQNLTPAEKLCNLINAQVPDSCEVEVESQEVTLLSDVILTETLEIPTGGEIIFDIGRRNVVANGDFACIYVPETACLRIDGRRGIIMGGTDIESGDSAIINRGTLIVDGKVEIIGGGNVLDNKLHLMAAASSSGSASSGGGGSGGVVAPGNGGGSGSTSGDETIAVTIIPGTVFAKSGGVAIINYGELYLKRGKLVGGEGTVSHAPALNGIINGGRCILFSNDDEEYIMLNTSKPSNRYIYAREGSCGEELCVALNIAESGCCEYELSTNEQTEEVVEMVRLVSDVSSIPVEVGSRDSGIASYPLVFDIGTHTLTIIETIDEYGDVHNSIGFNNAQVHILGSGTINAHIGGLYADISIEGVTISDGLSGMYSDCIIKSGAVNGIVAFIGSLQIDGGEIYGYIDGLFSEITINGGTISGETDKDIDVSRGTVLARSEDIIINGGTIIGGTSSDGTTGYNAVTVVEDDKVLYFNGGLLVGGTGSVSSGKAVEGVITKGAGTVIEQSDDGIEYIALTDNTSDSKYIRARLPEKYRINSINIKDVSGNELSVIPSETFLATMSFTNISADEDMVIVLAQYNGKGDFKGLMYIQSEDVPMGSTIKLSVPIDNTIGDIARLKAFCLESFASLIPMGNAVNFPAK